MFNTHYSPIVQCILIVMCSFLPIGSITYSLMYGLLRKRRPHSKSINKIQDASKMESSISSSSGLLDLDEEYERRVFYDGGKGLSSKEISLFKIDRVQS